MHSLWLYTCKLNKYVKNFVVLFIYSRSPCTASAPPSLKTDALNNCASIYARFIHILPENKRFFYIVDTINNLLWQGIEK